MLSLYASAHRYGRPRLVPSLLEESCPTPTRRPARPSLSSRSRRSRRRRPRRPSRPRAAAPSRRLRAAAPAAPRGPAAARRPPPAGDYGAPPPPPPPPPGYGTPAMAGVPAAAGLPFNVGDAFSWGWKKFTENVGTILIAVVVYVAIVARRRDHLVPRRSGHLRQQRVDHRSTSRPGVITTSGRLRLLHDLPRPGPVLVRVLRPLRLPPGGRHPWRADPRRRAKKLEIGDMFKFDKFGTVLVAADHRRAPSTAVGFLFCFVGAIVVAFFTPFYLFFVIDKDLGGLGLGQGELRARQGQRRAGRPAAPGRHRGLHRGRPPLRDRPHRDRTRGVARADVRLPPAAGRPDRRLTTEHCDDGRCTLRVRRPSCVARSTSASASASASGLEQHVCVEAGAVPGVAGSADLVDQHEQGVAVAVQAHLAHLLDVPRRVALAPVAPAGSGSSRSRGPVVRVRCSASSSIQPTISTSRVSHC